MDLAKNVVDKMMSGDAFSQWLGIEVLNISTGSCELQMKVKDEMINGFDIAHGGISYSLADSCLAFAANSHGIQAVSIETSISHTEKIISGDILTATAKEINKSAKTGLYYITITNQNRQEVAHFKGTVYRTGKDWLPNKKEYKE